MRFNLLELLALPLLFVLISLAIPVFISDGYPIAKRAKSMVGTLRELDSLANGKLAEKLASLSAKEVNGMFADPNSEFDSLFGYDLRLDIWGNAYVCVENKTSVGERWQFYSKGVDRVSSSNGSDRDDLNSWDRKHDYYDKLEDSRNRTDRYFFAALWSLAIFAILIGIRRYWPRRTMRIGDDVTS